MDFEEYLIQKKISSGLFAKGDPIRFDEFQKLFDQMHPDSFTAQKLFLINEIRRKFPIGNETAPSGNTIKKVKPRPKMIIPKKK